MATELMTGSIGKNFLLWVDDVGSYLVSRGNEFTIGRSGSSANPDVPINGDLASTHATFQTGADYCVLIPHAITLINSIEATDPITLLPGDRIAMGSVELEVQRRHPLSSTVGLRIISSHNTQGAKNILLMGRSIILGNKSQNHITVENTDAELVIYETEHEERLFFRRTAPIDIGEHSASGQGKLLNSSCLELNDSTITVESLD